MKASKPEFKEISLDKLLADRRSANICDGKTLLKLRTNMEKTGLCPSLLVRPAPNQNGQFIIIDGHFRFKILEELAWSKAPCQIVNVDEKEAGVLLATLNRLRGTDDPRKRAELLDELQKAFDVSELLQWIPESKGELSDLLSLLQFDYEETQQRISQQLTEMEQDVPEMLNFVMSKADASFVKDILATFQPDESSDPSMGLIMLCKSVQPQTKSTEE